MEQNTISAIYIRPLLAGAIEQGHRAEAILAACHLPKALLSNPKSTIAFGELSRLVRYLMDTLKDESMGLLPQPTSRGTYELLVNSLLHCHTLGEALSEMVRLTNLKGDGLQHSAVLQAQHSHYRIEHQLRATQYKPLLIESYLISRYRLLCWLTRLRIPLTTVYLSHPPQAWADHLTYLFPNANTQHGQDFAGFSFDSLYLNSPILQQREHIRETLSLAFAVLPPQDERLGSLSMQVRDLLHHALRQQHRVLGLSDIARQLRLKNHTLRRRLATENHSYQQLLSLARYEVATLLLQQQHHSIEDIADKLAYTEVSSFIRAYKSWTGQTPNSVRKQQDKHA